MKFPTFRVVSAKTNSSSFEFTWGPWGEALESVFTWYVTMVSQNPCSYGLI